MMGSERKTMVMTDDEKKMTAYHEAGHALVALHEPASDPIHKATIIPRGRALGMVMRLPERDEYSYHRDKMHANMAVAMGGRVAEEIIFGHDKVSSGASGDIQYATDLARNMVTQWGMSDRVGPVMLTENQQEVFLGQQLSQQKNVSEATAQLIDAEVKRIVEEGLSRAKDVLGGHEDDLHKLAGALLEYETLSGEEIKTLMDGGTIDRTTGIRKKPVPAATGASAIPKAGRRAGGGKKDDDAGGAVPEGA